MYSYRSVGCVYFMCCLGLCIVIDFSLRLFCRSQGCFGPGFFFGCSGFLRLCFFPLELRFGKRFGGGGG